MGEGWVIREAWPAAFDDLGRLMVKVYSSLEGFPGPEVQPAYYDLLAHIGQMAGKPGAKLLVATEGEDLLGGLVYFSDMAQYGSGGTATRERNASGFRLLAVAPAARGRGVGAALVRHCIELAKDAGHEQVIIHTTAAMTVAWALYEKLGFERSPDLDFEQGTLPVFGFRLKFVQGDPI